MRRFACAAVFGLAFASCGSIAVGPESRTVGAACTTNADCAERCLTDDRHFPGGLCTVACTNDAGCPAGSVCLAEEGGLCVASCRADADCAGFGRGFVCDSQAAASGSGTVSICRVP
jgi:hypothetical protein